MKRRTWAVAACVAAAVALIAWLAAGALRTGGDTGRGPEPSVDTVEAEAESMGGSNEVGAAETVVVRHGLPAAASSVIVDVVDAGGRPVRGRLGVWASDHVPAYAPPLMGPVEGLDARFLEHGGRAEVQRDPARWLWMRASAAIGSGHALLPPGLGPDRVTIRLDAGRVCVHVFVVEPDLETAVVGDDVTVLANGAAGDGPPRLWRATTGGGGYARIELEPTGEVLLMAPGATPDDGPPYVQPLGWPESDAAQSITCMLVRPPRLQDVTLTIHARFTDRRLRPALALRRLDDVSGSVRAWPEPLHPGDQVAKLRVEPGTWEVVTVPLGRLAVRDASGGVLRVEQDVPAEFDIRLDERPEDRTVHLVGLPQTAFPLKVHPRRVGDTLAEVPEHFLCGPGIWRDAEASVALPAGRFRLAALTSMGPYLSETDVGADAQVVEAHMAAAADLIVRWIRPGPSARGTCWLDVRSAIGDEVAALRAEVIRTPLGVGTPARVARVIVPRGRVEVVAVVDDGNGAREVWRREVVVARSRLEIEVEGGG